MIIIEAKEHGIYPDQQVGKPLAALLAGLSAIDGEKMLVFEQGLYLIDRADCPHVYRAITNTTAAEEYKDQTDVNMHFVPFLLEHVQDLTIDGQGSTFLIDGKVTNAVITDCKNITIRNLKIDTVHPNLHKLTVQKQTPFAVEFALDKSNLYQKEKDGFCWQGNGYRLGFQENSNSAFWTGSIKPSAPGRLFRTAHPFMGALKIKEKAPYLFQASYLLHKKFEKGQTFYVFDAHRSDVGIFVEQSENITLFGVEQFFNYSLAYVAQDCTALTLDYCRFEPKPGSGFEVASLADFMQVCMCSGEVRVTNCVFDGAADDALNVHGIHFPLEKIQGNKVTAVFQHPQSWGFNPLHPGDAVELIDPETLLAVAKNKIITSKLVDERHIVLTLETPLSSTDSRLVLEDVDRCPSLYFADNILKRIITRAILYTSRGKAVIENNHFVNNTMSGVKLSDDAKNWYESGMCKDVTIQKNVFEDCGATPILIEPENKTHGGAVHSHIQILHNDFCNYHGACIKIKSSENILIKGNQFHGKIPLKEKNCIRLQKDF